LYDKMATFSTSTDMFEDLLGLRGGVFSSLTSGVAEESLRYQGGRLIAGGSGGLTLAEGGFKGSGSGIVASDRPL
jgi:hypothetical protein